MHCPTQFFQLCSLRTLQHHQCSPLVSSTILKYKSSRQSHELHTVYTFCTTCAFVALASPPLLPAFSAASPPSLPVHPSPHARHRMCTATCAVAVTRHSGWETQRTAQGQNGGRGALERLARHALAFWRENAAAASSPPAVPHATWQAPLRSALWCLCVVVAR